jgi:hypothetical protein
MNVYSDFTIPASYHNINVSKTLAAEAHSAGQTLLQEPKLNVEESDVPSRFPNRRAEFTTTATE